MTNTMRAFLADPQSAAGIRLGQIPVPRPEPNQVLVGVEAFSINRGETFLLERPPDAWRPGKDVAGRVIATGAGPSGVEVGQRVVAHPEQGGWAEKVVVAADRLAPLPDAVPLEAAAALPLAGLTALRLTRVTGPLAARRVLLTGASGGVGHFFVQLAAAHGAEVTAVCTSEERGLRLLELGASEVIADLGEAKGPFDIALESTGGSAPALAWAALRQHGRLVWFGQASGTPPRLDFFNWEGATSGTIRRFHYAEDEASVSADLAALVRLVEGGRLTVEVGLLDGWERTAEAIEALLARRVRGNAVLEVNWKGTRK